MSSLSLSGLKTGLNNYYSIDKAVIRINSGHSNLIEIKISNGEMLKEMRQWKEDGKKFKSIFVPGKGFKKWRDGKLVTSEKYTQGTIRTRVGVGRYKKEIFGKNCTHLQKRSCNGGFVWEEVYWPNGQLMYKYSKGKKKGQFFNEKGGLWGTYEGELNWGYLYNRCILTQHWNKANLDELLRDGPTYKNNTGYFVWYDKDGKVQWKGQYESRQRTGIWVTDYVESVYIRGVSVPKELSDAKPEDIDVFRVITEKNAQLRAVLIEKIGMHRVINELKGEIIDEDKTNEYSLINIRLAPENDKSFLGDKIINLLKVKCSSTGAFYTLRVPPDIKTVAVARQWTFGIDPDSEGHIKEENMLEFAKET
ncbi:MAG: hypothetical protein KGJ11_00015 [Candidatus Omnitrophica bacterium]|nr:hypothetical protein [Candidatus Omnitrophota bacterium]